MIERDKVLEYNSELKAALTEMWEAIPKGQRMKILREHPKVRACLVRFGIVEVET